MMLKVFLKGLAAGIAITVLCVALVVLTQSRPLARVLFLPATAIQYLRGPSGFLGYDQNGQAMYEGTPLDLFIVLFGIVLSVAFYSLVSSVFFLISGKFRNNQLKNANLYNNFFCLNNARLWHNFKESSISFVFFALNVS